MCVIDTRQGSGLRAQGSGLRAQEHVAEHGAMKHLGTLRWLRSRWYKVRIVEYIDASALSRRFAADSGLWTLDYQFATLTRQSSPPEPPVCSLPISTVQWHHPASCGNCFHGILAWPHLYHSHRVNRLAFRMRPSDEQSEHGMPAGPHQWWNAPPG